MAHRLRGALSPLNWLSWLFGAALLGVVIVIVLRFSEEREFVRLLEQAHPWALLAGVALQAGTYFAEGEVWRDVARAAGYRLRPGVTYQLGLAKLFIDQAVPTGGISGTVLYVQGLERLGVDRSATMAGVVITTFSYYGSYALCLGAALIIATLAMPLNWSIVAAIVTFLVVSLALSLVLLLHAGRQSSPVIQAAERIAPLRKLTVLLNSADPVLVRQLRLNVRATAWQILIVLLDAATLWVLLLAIGAPARLEAVFTCFMISSVVRSLSIFVPGGLGIFDAASVIMLESFGTPMAAALSATLLFRGLSFWAPMVPGVLIARRVVKGRGAFATTAAREQCREVRRDHA